MLREDLEECLCELPSIVSHQMEDFFRGSPLELSVRRTEVPNKASNHLIELVISSRARTTN